MEEKLSSPAFYGEYYGHRVEHLSRILPKLRESSDRLIWTAGDSSLDNKHWFSDRAEAPGAYRDILHPPQSKQDVTYWLNHLCERAPAHSPQRQRTAAINTAVEATTLNERTFRLRPQDVFLRDKLQSQDVLIVSIGGNDVALLPCPCTVLSIAGLVCCTPKVCLEKGFTCGTVPLDDCCCGCGPSLCSCACGCPPCLGFNRHLFGTRVQKYIEKLVAKTKPAQILVCMIYYPDEQDEPGWAGPALGALGYNSNPAKLQMLIRKAFHEGVSRIRIPGSQVIPVPLFRVLDGKTPSDYVQRVEPSPSGGCKMAEFLLDMMDHHPGRTSSAEPLAPASSYIQGRG
jgi:lysophospholipase L1-like esterase